MNKVSARADPAAASPTTTTVAAIKARTPDRNIVQPASDRLSTPMNFACMSSGSFRDPRENNGSGPHAKLPFRAG
jgi:hypothetical protein